MFYCDNKVAISIAQNPVIYDRRNIVKIDTLSKSLKKGSFVLHLYPPHKKLQTF